MALSDEVAFETIDVTVVTKVEPFHNGQFDARNFGRDTGSRCGNALFGAEQCFQ
jgi:hypothetical protein